MVEVIKPANLKESTVRYQEDLRGRSISFPLLIRSRQRSQLPLHRLVEEIKANKTTQTASTKQRCEILIDKLQLIKIITKIAIQA